MSEPDPCCQFEEELQSALDQRVDPRTACGRHPHLQQCPACRQLLADFALLDATFQTIRSHCHLSSGKNRRRSSTARQQKRRRVPDEFSGLRGRIRRTMILPKALAFSALVMIGLVATSRRGPERLSPVTDFAAANVPDTMSDLASLAPIAELPPSHLDMGGGMGEPAVLLTSDNVPPKSYASTVWIADQLPGIPPIRHTATQAIHWIRSVVPVPPPLPSLPPLPKLFPDLGMRTPTSHYVA